VEPSVFVKELLRFYDPITFRVLFPQDVRESA
jgi:hypothetical protein